MLIFNGRRYPDITIPDFTMLQAYELDGHHYSLHDSSRFCGARSENMYYCTRSPHCNRDFHMAGGGIDTLEIWSTEYPQLTLEQVAQETYGRFNRYQFNLNLDSATDSDT